MNPFRLSNAIFTISQCCIVALVKGLGKPEIPEILILAIASRAKWWLLILDEGMRSPIQPEIFFLEQT